MKKKFEAIQEEVRTKKEKRNVYLNLAWLSPADNTALQRDVSFDKVRNLAIDMFMDPAASAARSAAPVEDEEDGGEDPRPANLQLGRTEGGGRPWAIAKCVEKGFEIPLAVFETLGLQDLGKLERLGADAIVNAVWLAFGWARLEKDEEVVSAISALILDWPMDFWLIEGAESEKIEENKLAFTMSFPARVATTWAWRVQT